METLSIPVRHLDETITNNYNLFVKEIQEFLRVNPSYLNGDYRNKYKFVLDELVDYIWVDYNKIISCHLYYKQELAIWIGRNKNNLRLLIERLLSYWGDPELDCYTYMQEIIKKGREIEAIKKLHYKIRFN
jgi:hypothetical protein